MGLAQSFTLDVAAIITLSSGYKSRDIKVFLHLKKMKNFKNNDVTMSSASASTI